jgi:hypothetical protein
MAPVSCSTLNKIAYLGFRDLKSHLFLCGGYRFKVHSWYGQIIAAVSPTSVEAEQAFSAAGIFNAK